MSYSDIVPGGGSTAAVLNVRRRLDVVDDLIGLGGKRVADLGCGRGDYVRALLDYTPFVTGVEFSENEVEQYRKSGAPAGLVEVGDIEALRFDDAAFDVVLLNEVLEHVPDDRQALLEARRVLSPDGHLVVFSPNRLHPFETHGVSTRGGSHVPIYVPGIPYVPVRVGARWFRYHARNYWPRELSRLITSAGFEVVTRRYVWQTFENISGSMPTKVQRLAPALRAASLGLERTPILQRLGVSQLLIACPRG